MPMKISGQNSSLYNIFIFYLSAVWQPIEGEAGDVPYLG